MVIFCDMDGVLSQFTEGVVEVLANNGIPTPYKMDQWKLENNIRPLWRRRAKKLIGKALTHPGFWSLLQPHEGAIEGFKKLQEKGEVYIATTPWNSTACFKGKRQWIARYLKGFPQDRIIFIKDKSLLRGSLLIDDKPSNLHGFIGRTRLMDRPWNQEERWHLRVHSWKELLDSI